MRLRRRSNFVQIRSTPLVHSSKESPRFSAYSLLKSTMDAPSLFSRSDNPSVADTISSLKIRPEDVAAVPSQGFAVNSPSIFEAAFSNASARNSSDAYSSFVIFVTFGILNSTTVASESSASLPNIVYTLSPNGSIFLCSSPAYSFRYCLS